MYRNSPPAVPEGLPQGWAAAARALSSVAVLDATPDGQIIFATEKATRLLAKYSSDVMHLPEALVRCLKEHHFDGTMHLLPWVAQRGEKQLAVRLGGKQEGDFQLLLEEKVHSVTAEGLREALALTPREAEVLLWIVRGKTSPEIASILTCKAATVAKHTERIFAKLGVETRTAAAATAREMME